MLEIREGNYWPFLARRIPTGATERHAMFGVHRGRKILAAAIYYDWMIGGSVWVGGAISEMPFGARPTLLKLLTIPVGRWDCRTLLAETAADNRSAARFMLTLGASPIETTKTSARFPQGTVIYRGDLLAIVSRLAREKVG